MLDEPGWSRHVAPERHRKSGGIMKRLVARSVAALHRYRASFPVAWSQMIRAHFRSPVHAAAFFDCDAATARHWFEGPNAPSGAFVAHAIAAIPGALAMLRAA